MMENSSFKPTQLKQASDRLTQRTRSTRKKITLLLSQTTKKKRGFFSTLFSWIGK